MEPTKTDKHEDQLDLLRSKIKDVRITMLTTMNADGSHRSRPMPTQEIDPDGKMWFFTNNNSGLSHEVRHHGAINLSYIDEGKDIYVSISGTAHMNKSKEKIKELWNPMVKAWFPDGIDDPGIALICVDIDRADYWDVNKSKMVQLFEIVKGIFTHDTPDMGEKKTLKF